MSEGSARAEPLIVQAVKMMLAKITPQAQESAGLFRKPIAVVGAHRVLPSREPPEEGFSDGPTTKPCTKGLWVRGAPLKGQPPCAVDWQDISLNSTVRQIVEIDPVNGANIIELDEEDIRIAADLTGVAKDGKEVAHRPQQQRTEPDGSESISARLANVAVEGTPQAQETAEHFRRLIAVVGAHWH